MAKFWQSTTITKIDVWHSELATFYLDYHPDTMMPGQYMNLSIHNAEGKRIKRSYSLASVDGEQVAFLIVKVAEGAFTSELFKLSVGDTVDYMPRCMGRFHLDAVPTADTLWLLATGTGLSPYISMLKSEKIWRQFNRVILLHGVRYVKDLAYQSWLQHLNQTHAFHYVPVVSREDAPLTFRGRITDLLQDERFEEYTGTRLDPNQQHMMLCGHPQMILDVKQIVQAQGWTMNRKLDGQITEEKYWGI